MSQIYLSDLWNKKIKTRSGCYAYLKHLQFEKSDEGANQKFHTIKTQIALQLN